MASSRPRPDAPPALAWSVDNCQVERAMGVLGERWVVVVLREVVNGVRRFADIQQHSGVPKQVLSNRLALLVEQDILRRVPYREAGERERHEYRLTEKGFELYPVLTAIATWGERWYTGPEGPPVELVHRGCDHVVHAVMVCERGHRVDDPREVAPRPGPGARRLEGGSADPSAAS